MKHLVRSLLAVAMLVGFYLLAIGLTAGVVLGLAMLLDLGTGGLVGSEVLVLAVPVVLAIGYGVFFRTKEPEPRGMLLGPEDPRSLWAVARETAAAAGTRDVDEIRLVPEANAAVSDSATWMGLRRGTRRMYVGVPLLLVLDEPQMRAVVAHEFGHYSGRHHALSRITYRGAESIRRILSQLGTRNPVGRLLRVYGSLYFAISRSVNRRQELEADELAAQVTSTEVMASALLELEPAAVAWDWYTSVFVDMGTAIGKRPDGVLAGFAEFLHQPGVIEKLDAVRAKPSEPTASVYDTHPPIDRRVAALGVTPPVTRTRDGWGIDLLEAPDETLAALERELYEASYVAVSMAALAPAAGADAARRHARLVDDLLISQGRVPGLRTVMQYLGNGMSRELVRRELPPDLSEEDVTRAASAILGGYLSAALLSSGQAVARLDWEKGWVLVDRSGTDLDLPELVREVMVTPTRVTELDEFLRLTGVPADFRATDHEPAAPRVADPATSRFLGVISPVDKANTLVVHEDGLLVLPLAAWQRLTSQTRPISVADALEERKSRHVAWDRIELLRRIQLAGGQSRIVCTVAGEPPLEIKVGPRSGHGGEPVDAMRVHLGDRYRAEERVGTRV